MSERTHYRSCTLCEAICGLEIKTDGPQIQSIRGDKADPFSQGYLCPKGNALQDLHYDAERLRYPLRRVGDRWQQVSWEEAYDYAANEIHRIQQQHGRNALGIYFGNPPTHYMDTVLFLLPFMKFLGTQNRFNAASVDQLPQYLSAYSMFGHQILFPLPDLDRTQFFLVLGANPAVSNGSLVSAPDMRRRIQGIRQRGGRVVVIDPRRSETAALADTHYFVHPESDVLLLLALHNVLFAEGLVRLGRLEAFTDGLAALAQAVAPYPPERVAAHVGLEPQTIRQLARDFAAAKGAVAYGRLGICQQRFGALCAWLINALNVVTGNLDREGGAMFSLPAVDLHRLLALTVGPGHLGRFHSRVSGLPEFGDELPVAAMAEEMLTPGPGQIKAFLLYAGNPVLTTPQGPLLAQALQGLEFMVSVDFYLNETNQYAHLILPPVGPLEKSNYDLVFHAIALRNGARYSPKVFDPPPGCPTDWQIIVQLWSRLLAKRSISRPFAGLFKRVVYALQPEGVVDLLIKLGPYGWRKGRQSLSLARVKQHPHGLDLGALQPQLPARLFTPNKRIQLAPSHYLADLPRVETTFFAQPAPSSLRLIGRRDLRSNNSWMHNLPRLMRGDHRCTLLMHPADAMRLGLNQASEVWVRSAVGQVKVPLEVSEQVMPGVVSLPHGWGHQEGTGWSLAQNKAGASVNDLTQLSRIDALVGTSAVNGIPVTVEAI